MIQYDNFGRAYTTDLDLAKKCRVPDRRPSHFIKNDFLKKKYAIEWRWVDLYTKVDKYYVLPPAYHKQNSTTWNIKFDIDIELYGYQQDVINYVKDTFKAGKKSAMIISWTWSGKSLMMISVVRSLWLRTVIVAPTITIATMLVKEFWQYIDTKLIKGSKAVEFASVNVMTHQTFNRVYDNINWSIDLLLCDECFVAWTKVDWINIEDIKVGDYVRSYNHNTKKIEYKKVLHCFKKKATSLVKLRSWEKEIVCTPDHPFRDWLEYTTKKDRDMVFYTINQNNESENETVNNEKMYSMRKRIWSYAKSKVIRLKENMKDILFKGMLKRICQSIFIFNDGKNKSQICIWKNEEKESNVRPNCEREAKNYIKDNVTQTTNPMMKLKAYTNTTEDIISSVGSTNRNSGKDFLWKGWLIPNMLQNRYMKRIVESMNRGRLSFSQFFRKAVARQKETGIFTIDRVDNIEVYKQGSYGWFGEVCPDGYVYNIEVEDNNNYFVEDVLVHNCHHIPAKRINQFNLWKGCFICGLTATPDRKEFGIEGFEMVFGNLYDTKQQSLPVKVEVYNYEYTYNMDEVMTSQKWLSPESPEIFRRLMIHNTDRTKRLKDLLERYWREQNIRRIIVFTDRVEHVKSIASELRTLFPDVYEYYGDSDKQKVIDEFKTGIIVGNLQCCGEWFNIPSLELGVLFVSTQWTVSVDQAVGRVRRRYLNTETQKEKRFWYLVDFVDCMKFVNGKTKKLWAYGRNKIYKEKWWEVREISL